MSTISNTPESDIDRLFKEAQAAAGFQFLYTLVRIDGIQCWDGYEDEFLKLRESLGDSTFSCSLGNYQRLAASPGPINLLQNLANCVQGGLYDVSPLRPLVKGAYPNFVRPTPQEIVNFIVMNLRNAGFPNLADLFASAYLPQFSGETAEETPALGPAFENLHRLLRQLFDRYYEELKVECPALFVPVGVRQTGMEGAWNGEAEEAHA